MCWEEREKVNKIRIKNFVIFVRTISYLRVYCSSMPKVLRFKISYEGWFWVFGVPNAKYLAFDTPDGNALKKIKNKKTQNSLNIILFFILYESL